MSRRGKEINEQLVERSCRHEIAARLMKSMFEIGNRVICADSVGMSGSVSDVTDVILFFDCPPIICVCNQLNHAIFSTYVNPLLLQLDFLFVYGEIGFFNSLKCLNSRNVQCHLLL